MKSVLEAETQKTWSVAANGWRLVLEMNVRESVKPD